MAIPPKLRQKSLMLRLMRRIPSSEFDLKPHKLFLFLFIGLLSFSGFGQKGKNSGQGKNNKDIIPVLECVKDLRNGLYQATFGYKNPRNKEVVIDENGSIIKSNKGKKTSKGMHKFKRGTNMKAFTKEFGSKDYVEWTIISNGRTHKVIANANSAKKCNPEDGLIVPVIGNGKSDLLYGNEVESFCLDIVSTTLPELIFQSKTDNGVLKILIEIVPKQGQMSTVLGILQGQLGVQNNDFLLDPTVYDFNNYSSIDVFLDKPTLCDLDNFAVNINFARPVYPTYNSSGGVLSQGDAAQTSDKVKQAYRTKEGAPIDGTGVTIRVLSDSYDMLEPGNSYAAIGVANGEHPVVTVLNESRIRATDEGRAMIEIIHDVAPGAAIQFSSGMSPNDFIAGVDTSIFDYDIIVDDITFITEPFFGDGRVTQAIINTGKLHYTSVGNLANKAVQGVFNSTSTMPSTNFIDPASSTVAHDFDPSSNTDYLQKISVVPGTYLIALQYENDAASQYNDLGAFDDLDIYIVDDLGRLLVGSNRVNIEGDPTEIIVFRATGIGEANILITSANGPTNVPFRYIAFRTAAEDGTPDGLKFEEYFGSGSTTITGHAMKSENSLNALTTVVGAVDFRNAASPVAQYFSSYGGLLPDGTNLETSIYAPDGTSTSFFGQFSSDPDAPPKFYGTSAAAPHAAAAMALLQSALPAWYPPTDDQLAADPTLKTSYTNAQALASFTSTTTEFSVTPPPGSSGGLLNSLAAFKGNASQSPNITKLVVLNDAVPSAEPFTVMIIGDFFPDNVEDVTVLFDGQPLEDVAYSTGDDGARVVTATVPVFTRNPIMQVVARSITDGGFDGQGGETATVLSDGKTALNIIANNAQFEYGQDIGSYYRPDTSQPDYIPSYTVEGLADGVTFESLGLPPIVLANAELDNQLAGNGYPIVSDYVITPSFGGQVLTQEQLDKYQINFISGFNDDVNGKNGYLTINKKDLTITPLEGTYTYGDAIDLTFDYSYSTDNISNNTEFYNLIEDAHTNDFYSENSLIIINKLRAVVNEQQILDLLDNGSWMTSDRVIQNKLRAVVNGMNLIDLEAQHFDDYLNTETDPITNKLRAVVNKLRAVVNGQDLINNNIDLFDPVNNKLRAVVNETGINNGDSFSEIFAVIDAEDGSTDTEDRTIDKFYSINLLSAMEVVEEGKEGPQVYPGAFISPLSVNFNTSYINGNATFLPKELNPIIDNIVLPYGEELTLEKLDMVTDFEGWAFEGEFKESEAIVFPEGVPYYFIKVDGDDTELELGDEALKERGTYIIKIRNPQNYVIKFKNDVTVTFTREGAPLSFEFVSMTIKYGETPVIDPTSISGFAFEDTIEVLEVDGKMPYYFKKEGDATEYTIDGETKMGVGVYNLYLKNNPSGNYSFDDSVSIGSLTVEEAILKFAPTALTIEYGVTPTISPNFNGFVHGENESVLKVDDEIPYYFIKEGDATVYKIGDKMGVGVHEMFLTDDLNDNYSIENVVGRGQLTIVPLHVAVQTNNLEKEYGTVLTQADLSTNFNIFAYGESVEDVFGSAVLPYYLEDTQGEYEINAIKDVGVYSIRIRETNANYIFDFDSSFNHFEVTKRALNATIDDLTINPGDIPVFTSSITGFASGESIASVFDNGLVPYYVVDQNDSEVDYMNAGTYYIKIRDPKNYYIDYLVIGKLTVKARWEKIKIYLDCVTYDHSHDNHHYCNHHELKYTAKFRYVNPNNEAIVISYGSENKIFGYGRFEKNTPTVFLPGENNFEIRFDGRKIIWKLKSLDGDVKRTEYAVARKYSDRCDYSDYSKSDHYDIDKSFVLYPNPVKDYFRIEQKIEEASKIEIYNTYGVLLEVIQTEPVSNQVNDINMSAYPNGQYFVRISVNGASKVYTIIKE